MNRRKVIRIEASSPTIDCGAYPVKRIVGDELTVTADIFPDSQNALRAHVRWCAHISVAGASHDSQRQ
jgi:hypothetical protein